MSPILLLSIVLQIGCAVHVVRTGRPMYWIFLLLIGSYIAVVIYVIAEVVPEMRNSAGARRIVRSARDTKSKIARNFGMPRPEGYRKALRLMKLAERFKLPLLTFIDTAGAWPGIDAEERGQSEAIARNLLEMAELRVPIICTVIGEGGSGGALAIGVGDITNMLEYSTYSVITPEGCASILWRDAGKAKDAAEQLGLTAKRLLGLGLIDKVVREPTGGAHRNPVQMARRLKAVLLNELDALAGTPIETLLENRYRRLRGYGAYEAG